MTEEDIKGRLEYLRAQIDGNCISYGELAELEDLAEHIDDGDVQLLQWAGVPEKKITTTTDHGKDTHRH
jgi:esterase/lipase superfamily enzyme